MNLRQTGLNVLTNNTVLTLETSGITIDIPGTPNPIDEVANGFSQSTCIMNAPDEIVFQEINTDICIDMTDSFSLFSELPGISVTPPVTLMYSGTATATTVSDCFSTDAATVTDNFTGETWVRDAFGQFVQVGL